MNELRMYVEHLFEGRVLTAEMIELKEEIYGNLVARYEDYVAGGMDEAEALAQVKASITSIDDVLAGEGEDAFEGAASSASEDAEPTAVHASDDDAGESTCEEGAATEGAAATVVQPAPATASTADASDHANPWLKILVVAAAVIAVILAAVVVWSVVLEPTGDQLEDTVEDVVDATVAGDAGQTSNGNNQDTDSGNGAGTNANTSNTPTFSDPEDRREYEATMAVLDEIDVHDPTTLQVYTGDSQPSSVFFENLPLGSYVSADDTVQVNANTFEVYYTNVSEDIDGDAIDRAIVYNAAAAFSAYPNLQYLNVVVHEAYDEHHDADVYAFDRSQLERAFANASGDAVTQFNSSLFESEASWDVVRQQIDRHDFCDHQMDVAERS